MDDFNIQALTESRNSYTNLLLSKLTPQICQGFEAIFKDTYNLCEENDEEEKYLMTFQNFLARIPNWNQTMVNDEVERIINECNCSYLEDLLTCVHVTQLKILTSVRVGQKQKQISIDVPSIHTFVHNVYKYCARTLYKNVYLYDINVMPLDKQKYKKEIETIIKDEIVNVVRSSMPIESILKAYLDETTEQYDELEESELEKELILQEKEKELKRAEIQSELQTVNPDVKPEPQITVPEVKEVKPVVNVETVEPLQKTELKVDPVSSSSSSSSSSLSLTSSSPSPSLELQKQSPSQLSSPVSSPVMSNKIETELEMNPVNSSSSSKPNGSETFIGSDIPQSANSSLNSDIESDNESDDEKLSIDFDTNANIDLDLQDISSDKSNKLLNMDDIEELH